MSNAPEQVLDPATLARYADLVAVTCLALQPDDVLFLAAHTEHRELLVALAEAAYRAGASIVDIAYDEPRAAAARVRYATDENLGLLPDWQARRLRASKGPDRASLFVVGEADPGVFDGLAPERVAGRLRPPHAPDPRRRTREPRRPDPLVGLLLADRLLGRAGLPRARDGRCEATPRRGHPLVLPARARRPGRRLGLGRARDDARRAGARPSPSSGWPGCGTTGRAPTSRSGSRPGTVFVGGRRLDAYGHVISANVPTEECYTSPQAGAASGTFRCSLPLSFRGRLIEGIAGEFRGGRLVRLEADTEANRDFLAAFLDSEPNARRLGEVALVDASSRIGQSERVYFNTLLDENAAAHIAFGAGFGLTRRPDARRGVNRANLHVDVMIGTDDLEVTGTTANGNSVPLISGGTWQI